MESTAYDSVETGQLHRWWWRAWLFIALLLIAHTAIRCLLSKNLDVDEAEQLVLIQHLSLGYSAQPPLYSWLVWSMAQLVGANVVALALVKGLILLTLYFQMSQLGCQLLPDRRAILALFVPLLLPLFAWEALRMSHTPLLCLLCLATLLSLLRLERAPNWANYLLLGCSFGLGMLTKYNYALFATAGVLACLVHPRLRSIILQPRFLVSLLVGALILLPHACWAIGASDEIAAYLRERMGLSNAGLSFVAYLRRVGMFCFTLFVTGGIPLALIFVLAWRTGWRFNLRSSDAMQLLMLTTLIGLSLYLAIILLGRMQHFRGHWLAPFLLLIPICLLSKIPPLPSFSHAARLYITAAVVMSLAILGVRSSSFFVDYHQGKYQTRDYLFSELADSLAAQGLYPEQVISGDVQCAGYSRIYLGDSPVQCSSFLNRKPKRVITSVTLVVWDATQDEGFCSETSQVFQAWFKEHVPDEMIRHIVTSPRTFDTRTKRLGYCVLMPRVEYSTMKPTVPTP